MNLRGCPYPIVSTPLGFLPTIYDANVIKADLMQLLLTNPGERVMMPSFGTPLRQFLFEQNNPATYDRIKNAITAAIERWETRIVVTDIIVRDSQKKTGPAAVTANMNSNSVYIQINFLLPDQINAQELLVLEIPVGG